MNHNIGDMPAEDRQRIERERAEALEKYKAQRSFATDVDREYNLILSERGRQRDQWRGYVHRKLAEIRCEKLRAAVLAKLNAFQDGIAGGRI